MRQKKYVKIIVLCVCILSVISIIGLVNFKTSWRKVEMTPITNLLTDQEISTTSTMERNETLRQYNKYTSEVQLMAEGYFTGIQTIKYIHEFENPTDKLLIKLNLNSYSEEYHKLFLKDQDMLSPQYYGNLYITDVRVNGEKANFKQEQTNLWIKTTKQVEDGQEVNISLAFHGKLPEISGNRKETFELASWEASMLPKMGVFEESRGWNTNYDYSKGEYDYSEIGDYKVTFLTKEEKVPIVTGNLIEDQELEDGTHKYVYEAKKVRDFGIYYGHKLNEYVVETSSGMKIHIYSPRVIETGVVGSRFNEIFNYYSTIMGRYPYDTFKVIDCKGLEKNKTYSGMLITDLDQSTIYYDRLYEGIGKQWIPYILQQHPIADSWLNSGLGEYLAKRGTTSLEGMKKYLKAFEEKQVNATIEEQKRLDYLQFFYKMEQVLGTEEWHKFLKTYYKQNAFKILGSENFIKLLLEDSEPEVGQLFNVYINELGDGKDDTQ